MVTSTIPRNRRTRERSDIIIQKDSYVLGGDHLILREGRAGKFCRDRLFIFSMSSTRKFIFMYTKARLFIFIRNKILKKQKQKQPQKTQGEGVCQNVGSEGCQDQDRIFSHRRQNRPENTWERTNHSPIPDTYVLAFY